MCLSKGTEVSVCDQKPHFVLCPLTASGVYPARSFVCTLGVVLEKEQIRIL